MKESNREWGKHFQQLVEYKSIHGDCNHVPLDCSRHPDLGKWLSDQRASYINRTLKDERKDRLNGIGVVLSDSYTSSWELRFQQLLEYKETKGNCNVPRSSKPNKLLNHWVVYQRKMSNNNKLSKKRKDKLNSIGFDWGIRRVDWDTRFEQLVQYKWTHGNCNVPRYYKLNPQLGRWVCEQRCLHSKNALRKDRLAVLESIGFRFSRNIGDWCDTGVRYVHS
jgi:hypothetical protein